MRILGGLLDGRSIDAIIEGIPSRRVKKKADEIKAYIENNLDPSQIFLVESSLQLINDVQSKIELDLDIRNKINPKTK